MVKKKLTPFEEQLIDALVEVIEEKIAAGEIVPIPGGKLAFADKAPATG